MYGPDLSRPVGNTPCRWLYTYVSTPFCIVRRSQGVINQARTDIVTSVGIKLHW